MIGTDDDALGGVHEVGPHRGAQRAVAGAKQGHGELHQAIAYRGAQRAIDGVDQALRSIEAHRHAVNHPQSLKDDAVPLLGDGVADWADGRFGEGVEFRIEALVNFGTVSTFISGFALADLSTLVWDEFHGTGLSEIYVMLMSFAAGCSACNSVLAIMLVVAYQRVKSWDLHIAMYARQHARFDRTQTPNYEIYSRAFGDPKENKYSEDLFRRMFDSESAPLRLTMQLFPWAVVSYTTAVAVKVLASSSASADGSLLAQLACPIIVALFALPTLLFARKMMQLVVA